VERPNTVLAMLLLGRSKLTVSNTLKASTRSCSVAWRALNHGTSTFLKSERSVLK
jgi:hypothetical protein